MSARTSCVVVGAGAIGQFYAAQFILAGDEVGMLARRDADRLKRIGLSVVQSPTPQIASTAKLQQFTLRPEQFRVADQPAALVQSPPPDWILVALKTTALAAARPLIEPLIGPRTGIVALCNGLGVEDRLAEWFGPARIFGLLCFVCVNRDPDGTIRHLGHGGVAAGHFEDDPAERQRLASWCRNAGIQCAEPASLLEARWRKLVWNVAYNGLAVLNNCTTDRILADAQLRAESRALMQEIVTTGNADLAARGSVSRIEKAWIDRQEAATEEMDAYAPSTLLDARAGRALESDLLFVEPLRRAQRLGISAPALERLVRGLAASH